jgi:hypothetical protein
LGLLKLKRRKIDISQEKKLITNLITSTRFCKEIIPLTTTKLLKAENSKNAFRWIDSYYEKYKEAPKSNLESLFDEAMVDESESTIETTSSFLENLSYAYEKLSDVNIKYEVDQARDYIKRRSIEVTVEESQLLLSKERINKAEEVLKAFSNRKEAYGDIVANIATSSVKSADFAKEEIDIPTMIISPWLTDGNISMIYAPRGIGKTWLSLTLAVLVTRDKAVARHRFGPWEVMNQSGALYIDGEMGEYEMQDRVNILEKMYGEESTECPLMLLTASRYARDHGAQINISTEEFRSAIYQYLYENEQYQLLILDNIASLTPGLVENSKEDWDPINQWLISLRHLGVSVLLIHHAGKGNAQRGTSGREDSLDCIIKMKSDSFYRNEHGARFTIIFEKSRNIPPGPGLQSFDMQLLEDGKGGIMWERVFAKEKDEE